MAAPPEFLRRRFAALTASWVFAGVGALAAIAAGAPAPPVLAALAAGLAVVHVAVWRLVLLPGTRIAEQVAALNGGVVASALDAVVTADHDCRIVAFNPAAERIFGHRAVDVIGKPIGEMIVPPHLRDAHEAGMRRYRATNVPHVLGRRIEVEAMRSDGSVFPAELAIRRVDAAGRTWFTASLRDLSGLRAAQAEVERQRERLHQSEKMSAMGSLLAGVAHELNNPLTVVVAETELLEAEGLAGSARDRTRRIQAAAQRCGRIVKSFLAMVRQTPPVRGPVDLNAVVQGAIELLAYQLRSAGIEVETALEPRLPMVEGDADQLAQIVANLVVNAHAAMVDAAEPRILTLLSAPEEAGMVVLTVEDSGPGVLPALRERIFEPYFTTRKAGAGTGVGLAVCRRIVAAHGGTIGVGDAAAGGARFQVRLPASSATIRPEPPGARDDVAGMSILVVDDEADVGEALAAMLRMAGAEVRVERGVETAAAILAKRRWDVVACDLRMPGGGARCVIDAATAIDPTYRQRFVLVTGDTVATAGGMDEGLSDLPVLEKPFGRAEALAVIASAARRDGSTRPGGRSRAG